jgi:hypothetical protein
MNRVEYTVCSPDAGELVGKLKNLHYTRICGGLGLFMPPSHGGAHGFFQRPLRNEANLSQSCSIGY